MAAKIGARILVYCIALLPLSLFGNYSGIFSDALSTIFPNIDFHYNIPLCKSSSYPATFALEDKDRSIDSTVEEYKTATKEIQVRLEQEHLLFALKFVLAGAVLGIVFRYYPRQVHLAQVDGGDGMPTMEKYPTIRFFAFAVWPPYVSVALSMFVWGLTLVSFRILVLG